VILLASAVAREVAPWARRHGVDALATGVGPVEAACAVAYALAQRRYRLVVNAGIAGAFDGVAAIGDGIVVADDTFVLTRENGQPLAPPDGEPIVENARSDAALVKELQRRGFAALHGITVSRVTTAEETAAELVRAGAQVESMEGFAVLRACDRAGVAAIQVRGISNRVGSLERSGWDFAAGLAGLTRIMNALFETVELGRASA